MGRGPGGVRRGRRRQGEDRQGARVPGRGPGWEPPPHPSPTWMSSCRSRSHFLMPLSREPLNRVPPWMARHSMPS